MASSSYQSSAAVGARIGLRRWAIVTLTRSILLGAAVFTVAALTGALLSGTAPAMTAVEQNQPASAPPPPPAASAETTRSAEAVDSAFAGSLLVSGAAALAVSVTGIVIVARRRRTW